VFCVRESLKVVKTSDEKLVAMSTPKDAGTLREEGNHLYKDGKLVEGTLSLLLDRHFIFILMI
jgi:hypothetical protein